MSAVRQTSLTHPFTGRGSAEEVRGVFPNDATLREAVRRLSDAGFDRSRLIQPAPGAPLRAATPNQAAENADTEEGARQLRTLRSSTAAAAAAMAGAAAVVATGGAAAAALAVAGGAGLAAGGGVLAGSKIGESAISAERDDAAAEGRLRLIVSVSDDMQRTLAEDAMRLAGGSDISCTRG